MDWEWITELRLRLKSLLKRRQLDRDLEDELSFHLAMREEKYVAGGSTPAEAHNAARRDFGNFSSFKEVCRDMWTFRWLEILRQDVRYALRVFRKNPSVTTVVVLSLALGIGANTAIFSVINAVMIRALPVENPHDLVQVRAEMMHNGEVRRLDGWSLQIYRQFREQNHVFTDVLAAPEFVLRMDAENIGPSTVQLVSTNFFSVLGVNAVLGRTFNQDENGPVALISYEFWDRIYGHDPGILGRTIIVAHMPLTIIGVTPRHFPGVDPSRVVDVWAPLNATVQPTLAPRLSNPFNYSLPLIGRLKPGISVAEAQADMQIMFRETQKNRDLSNWPDDGRREYLAARIIVEPAASGVDFIRRLLARSLFLLMAIVAFVLLIACANVANLLVAQASARRREIVTRLALGAGRNRIIRQLLTESVLLAFTGGAIGIAIAWWSAPLVLKFMARGPAPVEFDVHPDMRVLEFTCLVSLITGILFGLAPGLGAANTHVGAGLKDSIRAVSRSWVGKRLGKGLVIAQVALSLLLLVGAGLLVRTLKNLESQYPGFNRNNVLLFAINASSEGYKGQKLTQLYPLILERLNALPGVQRASYSVLTPISGNNWAENITVEAYVPHPAEDMQVSGNSVSADYFSTVGTPVLLGRNFSAQDTASSTLVAVINQTMARRFFPGGNPLGHHVQFVSDKRAFEIIGVVGDAKYRNLREEFRPLFYTYAPQDQWLPMTEVTFEVRSAGNPPALTADISSILRQLDPRLKPALLRTLSEQVDESLYQERMIAALSSLFGLVALLLASIGLYALMAYAVLQRTNEIGVRMALGARRGDVLFMVLRNGLMLVLAGLVIGILGSLATTRLLSSQLYGLKPTDPLTVIAAGLILLLVAGLAGLPPARRAATVDPVVALRYQ